MASSNTASMQDAIAHLEQTRHGPLVLLFYDGYDRLAREGWGGKCYAFLHRMLRFTKRTLCRQQLRTGYYTAFLSLVRSLEAVGCHVRINDFTSARKRPHYPIGVAGFPSALHRITLPNRTIFGHGDFGRPDSCGQVTNDSRFVTIIAASPWVADLYRPYCGDKMWPWFAGIDTNAWRDVSADTKHYDFLIYDKIRWHRQERVPTILHRIVKHMEAKGLSYCILQYGEHHHSQFVQALSQSRAMLFVCEHETQGIAYQEALASNLPVLAWDEGEMVDPHFKAFVTPEINVSSVPYFDAMCGLTFTMQNFEAQCDRFWAQRAGFAPRQYVENHLSLAVAGQRYLEEYAAIAAQHYRPTD